MDRGSLARLARLHGIQASYEDVAERRQVASEETLLAMLDLMGAGIARASEAPDAIRRCRLDLWRTTIEPVTVAWDDRAADVRFRVAASQATGRYHGFLALEHGETREFSGQLEHLPTLREREVEGSRYAIKVLTIAGDIPWGYHRLRVELPGASAETMLIAAPRMCWQPEQEGYQRAWGVFVPLYALHREASWGPGDFSDLETLMMWVKGLGGSLVATLPLLAWMGGDPSPYSPASRLFWNEFYIDITRVPEFERSAEARALLESPEYRAGEEAFRREAFVDYDRQMALKRRILATMAQSYFARETAEHGGLETYLRQWPDAELYAQFRAVGERQGKSWQEWPEPLRSGRIVAGEYDEEAFCYHLFAQWQVEQQLQGLADRARQAEMLWYLDLPLGASNAGYDVWHYPEVFVSRASGGAPPDSFFTKGQDWGFAPLHPLNLRKQGHRYWIDCLRRHLQYARILRIDHVMSLYRLWWVPHGMPASAGAYVRYPTKELCAVLALESHRHQAMIVGENLGTVPPGVDAAMEEHGLHGMYVLQYETRPHLREAVQPVPASEVASVNTHDMPPFAAFWKGLDIDDRLDLGLIEAREVPEQQESRERVRRGLKRLLERIGSIGGRPEDAESVLEGCLKYLAASPAPIVLATLEDLWLETQPQNTPGTFLERPNWRRKTRYSFEQFRELPAVRRILGAVDAARRKSEATRAGAAEEGPVAPGIARRDEVHRPRHLD